MKGFIISMLFSSMALAQNNKWLDSIYNAHQYPLQRGDRFVTKDKDTIHLLKPIKARYWKVKRYGLKMVMSRQEIIQSKRIKRK